MLGQIVVLEHDRGESLCDKLDRTLMLGSSSKPLLQNVCMETGCNHHTFKPIAQELWGTSSSKPVVVGNAKAEVTTTVVMPLAEWLGLEDATEQPDSSLMLKWPGFSAFHAEN